MKRAITSFFRYNVVTTTNKIRKDLIAREHYTLFITINSIPT